MCLIYSYFRELPECHSPLGHIITMCLFPERGYGLYSPLKNQGFGLLSIRNREIFICAFSTYIQLYNAGLSIIVPGQVFFGSHFPTIIPVMCYY